MWIKFLFQSSLYVNQLSTSIDYIQFIFSVTIATFKTIRLVFIECVPNLSDAWIHDTVGCPTHWTQHQFSLGILCVPGLDNSGNLSQAQYNCNIVPTLMQYIGNENHPPTTRPQYIRGICHYTVYTCCSCYCFRYRRDRRENAPWEYGCQLIQIQQREGTKC